MAIDGKSLRGSHDSGVNMAHLVAAYGSSAPRIVRWRRTVCRSSRPSRSKVWRSLSPARLASRRDLGSRDFQQPAVGGITLIVNGPAMAGALELQELYKRTLTALA